MHSAVVIDAAGKMQRSFASLRMTSESYSAADVWS
jgi:hypothetical protein